MESGQEIEGIIVEALEKARTHGLDEVILPFLGKSNAGQCRSARTPLSVPFDHVFRAFLRRLIELYLHFSVFLENLLGTATNFGVKT